MYMCTRIIPVNVCIQMCSIFPLRQAGGEEPEKRAEDLDSSPSACDHLVAYDLAPAITHFILDGNWRCCDNKLEQTLTVRLLHNE